MYHFAPLTEESNDERTFLFIVIISVAVAIGLLVVIIVVCILILVFRRKRAVMGRKRHAIATFKNASPPLKRHGKPHSSTDAEVAHNSYEAPAGIALAVLSYTEEPRAVGTPPPPDPTTFLQPPSPPSSALPPSYSDLEQTLSHDDTRQGDSTRAPALSNYSPPTGSGACGSSSDESAYNKIPLSVSYSNEPRTAGSSPSPHPTNDSRQDSLEESYRSEANSNTRILD